MTAVARRDEAPSSGAQDSSNSKFDIVNALGRIYGWDRYLEFCTASTGLHHARIDRKRYNVCDRFMYRCPADYDDGMPLLIRSPDNSIRDGMRELERRGRRYQVILVDPFHEYAESMRDLIAAFNLLDDGGALVVHDALPPDESLVSPRYHPDSWCGVTYQAYLDFVLENSSALTYFTINCDFGCGIIFRRPADRSGFFSRFTGLLSKRKLAAGEESTPEHRALVEEWKRVRGNDSLRYPFFMKNAAALLLLRTFDDVFKA